MFGQQILKARKYCSTDVQALARSVKQGETLIALLDTRPRTAVGLNALDGVTMKTNILYVLAVLSALGAGLLSLFLFAWYLSLRFSTLDALWQMPVLLCYPLWLLASLAVVFIYFSRRVLIKRILILSCIEALLSGCIWILVRNYWVLGR